MKGEMKRQRLSRGLLVVGSSLVAGCAVSLLLGAGLRFFGGVFPEESARVIVSEKTPQARTIIGSLRTLIRADRSFGEWAIVEPWWFSINLEKYDHCSHISVYASGWPLPCLYSVNGAHFPPPRSTGGSELAGYIFIRKWKNMGGSIPYFVVWTGLFVDTLVFASFILLGRCTLASCMKLNRVRSGRCIDCAYEIVGVAICPECGRGVHQGWHGLVVRFWRGMYCSAFRRRA